MKEEQYFNKISNIIEDIEANHKVRETIDNYETLKGYWEIGKLLIEAQGGEARAKYGNGLINEWTKIFITKYGKNYTPREMRRMRQFYCQFKIWSTVSNKLTWRHVLELLPLKNVNEKNYYVNLTIINHLSVRTILNF